jgi:hypothetical protein
VWGLFGALLYAQALAADDVLVLPLAQPYAVEAYGTPIFFTAQEPTNARIVTPGRKHIEINKSAQRLRAYDEAGRAVLEAPVSTGNPGIDEKGRQREETRSGIHRIVEVKPFKRWSKDPKVKMLNWIGMLPGVEKGIHSLEPVGEFADYEKLLGQKASHGCIRMSLKNSRRLVKWLGEDWKAYPLIIDIYDQPVHNTIPSAESPYLLFVILRQGRYRVEAVLHEGIPSVRSTPDARGPSMKPGDFILFKKEAETWRVARSSVKNSE